MARRILRFRFAATALLICVSIFVAYSRNTQASAKQKSTPKPAYSIPLRPLGYREPLFETILTGHVPLSLNFFTHDRLLFTFNMRGLLARDDEPCDGPFDDDQLVRAILLSLPDGKPLAETKWQLHDHNQYLWPVHDGVLLRRCHAFDLLQNSLTPNRILNFESRPMLVQTSPDGRTIVVETQHEKHTPEEHKQLIERAILGTGTIPAEDIDVNFIALDPSAVIAKVQERAPIYVSVVRDGLYNITPAPHNHWLIEFQSFHRKPVEITKVESNCAPPLFPLSEDVFLVATCVSALNYHVLIAYNRDGKELWRDEWLNNLSRPVFALSADNQRFAVGTVRTLSTTSGFGVLDEAAAHAEDITVYSTYKGDPLLAVSISPPYATGQNFALSPDGSQLAVINHGAIEVYDVAAKK